MGPAEIVVVKCHCCDTQFVMPTAVFVGMIVPSTFCERCYNLFDLLTLRKWFVLDMLWRQVQGLEAWVRQASTFLPSPGAESSPS